MNLNTSNLSHPRMQWEIEAAMYRAIESSRETGVGIEYASTAAGKPLLSVIHVRGEAKAFMFATMPFQQDCTQQVLRVLREQVKGVSHG